MLNAEPKRPNSQQWSKKWRLLIEAAKRSLVEKDYSLERVPGRGKSNVWKATKNGITETISIRTTQDRWFAFPPLEEGSKWKTLDKVDVVVVAAVDDREAPTAIETYVFPADEVRTRFNQARAARIEAGQTVKDNFGMWVSLDLDKRDLPASVGSGIVDNYPPVAVYKIAELVPAISNWSDTLEGNPEFEQVEDPKTVGEILAEAREQISTIAGVGIEAVKLELKIEY